MTVIPSRSLDFRKFPRKLYVNISSVSNPVVVSGTSGSRTLTIPYSIKKEAEVELGPLGNYLYSTKQSSPSLTQPVVRQRTLSNTKPGTTQGFYADFYDSTVIGVKVTGTFKATGTYPEYKYTYNKDWYVNKVHELNETFSCTLLGNTQNQQENPGWSPSPYHWNYNIWFYAEGLTAPWVVSLRFSNLLTFHEYTITNSPSGYELVSENIQTSSDGMYTRFDNTWKIPEGWPVAEDTSINVIGEYYLTPFFSDEIDCFAKSSSTPKRYTANIPDKILDYWNPELENDKFRFSIDTDKTVW